MERDYQNKSTLLPLAISMKKMLKKIEKTDREKSLELSEMFRAE